VRDSGFSKKFENSNKNKNISKKMKIAFAEKNVDLQFCSSLLRGDWIGFSPLPELTRDRADKFHLNSARQALSCSKTLQLSAAA
jgi:hypothetical protein